MFSSGLANGFNGTDGDGSMEPAVLRGNVVGGAKVQLPILEASMPRLNSQQLQELVDLLTKMAHWSKIEELYISRLKVSSRKNSKAEEAECADNNEAGREGEPRAKRCRLNGDRSVPAPSPSASELEEDLIRFSLESQLLCPFTYLRGVGQAGRTVIQLLPHRHHQNSQKLVTAQDVVVRRSKNGIVSRAKRTGEVKRHSHSHCGTNWTSPDDSSSFSFSMKVSLSTLASSFKSFASNLFQTPPPVAVEFNDCNTLEDELEMQKKRNTQLSWKAHGKDKLRYPQSYYMSHSPVAASSTSASSNSSGHLLHGSEKVVPLVNGCGGGTTCESMGHSLAHTLETAVTTSRPSGATSRLSCGIENGSSLMSSSLPVHPSRPAADNSSSSSDDEDDEISDSESDSSVTLASLPKARNHSHIIHMQLFNGAWPFENKFAYATLVPLSNIKPLPLTDQENSKWLHKPKQKGSGKGCQDDESASHFWCTVLAVVCLRDCFPEHEVEWKLVVAKGVEWIRRNLDKCGMELDEVYCTAHMFFKNSV